MSRCVQSFGCSIQHVLMLAAVFQTYFLLLLSVSSVFLTAPFRGMESRPALPCWPLLTCSGCCLTGWPHTLCTCTDHTHTSTHTNRIFNSGWSSGLWHLHFCRSKGVDVPVVTWSSTRWCCLLTHAAASARQWREEKKRDIVYTQLQEIEILQERGGKSTFICCKMTDSFTVYWIYWLIYSVSRLSIRWHIHGLFTDCLVWRQKRQICTIWSQVWNHQVQSDFSTTVFRI